MLNHADREFAERARVEHEGGSLIRSRNLLRPRTVLGEDGVTNVGPLLPECRAACPGQGREQSQTKENERLAHGPPPFGEPSSSVRPAGRPETPYRFGSLISPASSCLITSFNACTSSDFSTRDFA